ncbi:MAG: hypothetical protein R6V12_11695 [Candidatus Hydrogenedentota bacterium]
MADPVFHGQRVSQTAHVSLSLNYHDDIDGATVRLEVVGATRKRAAE